MYRPAWATPQSDQHHIFFLSLESIIAKLATCKVSVIWLVSVAEQTGLSLTLSAAQKTRQGVKAHIINMLLVLIESVSVMPFQ